MATLKGYNPGNYIPDYSGIERAGGQIASTISRLPAAIELAETKDDRIAATKAQFQDVVADVEQKTKLRPLDLKAKGIGVETAGTQLESVKKSLEQKTIDMAQAIKNPEILKASINQMSNGLYEVLVTRGVPAEAARVKADIFEQEFVPYTGQDNFKNTDMMNVAQKMSSSFAGHAGLPDPFKKRQLELKEAELGIKRSRLALDRDKAKAKGKKDITASEATRAASELADIEKETEKMITELGEAITGGERKLKRLESERPGFFRNLITRGGAGEEVDAKKIAAGAELQKMKKALKAYQANPENKDAQDILKSILDTYRSQMGIQQSSIVDTGDTVTATEEEVVEEPTGGTSYKGKVITIDGQPTDLEQYIQDTSDTYKIPREQVIDTLKKNGVI